MILPNPRLVPACLAAAGLSLLWTAPLSAAKIYQYTNSDGETVFTDERVEGATVHEVEDAPEIPMTPVDVPGPREEQPRSSDQTGEAGRQETPASPDRSPDTTKARDTAEAASDASKDRADEAGGDASKDRGDEAENAPSADYQLLKIIEPSDGEVASRLENSIGVELALQPNLKGGDRINVLVDGEPRVRDSTGRRHLISGVAPGRHELVAQIHRNGEVIKESAPVRFQLMTPSQ